MIEQFDMSTLARRSAEGTVHHQPGYYLPKDLKPIAQATSSFVLSELTDAHRERLWIRYAIVQAVEELITEGLIRNNDDDIAANLDQIGTRTKQYLKGQCDLRDLDAHELQEKGEIERKRRGGSFKTDIEMPSAGTIRKSVTAYRKFGMAGLADNYSKSGYRSGYFTPEETRLLGATVISSYMTLERKTVSATVIDVARAFKKENNRREEEGLPPLRVPGRDAVRSHIKKLDKLAVMIARYGKAEAIKRMRPSFKGLEVERPLQRVEMDEWKIDLSTILDSAQLHAVFGTQFLTDVGLDGGKGRWWLVVAIDVRTRVILGMKLTRDPKSSAAVECLRMVVSDKGAMSDAVGAMSSWYQRGVMETLSADNGPGFKAWDFTQSCTALGTTLLRTIAGVPGMRGTVERAFRTASVNLSERLAGRTFGNSKERGDYPTKERTIHDADDLAFALVRWVVDIYHNTPHTGLGGRTPVEQWEADMLAGNYPLHALPDTRTKRKAFGLQLQRTLSKTGVTVLGVRYNTQSLAAMFTAGGKRSVELLWDSENIGAIEVKVDGSWFEVKAVHDRYEGVNAHTWMQTRRALRSRSAGRKAWNQQAVFAALDDIEAMGAHKSAVFGLVDKPMTEKQLEDFERTLFSSFEIDDKPLLSSSENGHGRVIVPRSPDPVDATRAQPEPSAVRRAPKPSPTVETPANTAPSTTSGHDVASGAPGRTAPKFTLPTSKEPKKW